jgi:hypothetical protein
MEKRISLFEVFGNNLITRNSISDFFNDLKKRKEKKITLDFEKITFISRSCADEYLKQKKECKNEIIEINLSANICEMFNLVNKQYKKEDTTFLIKIIPECKTNSLVFN